jgi:hypothetical protein
LYPGLSATTLIHTPRSRMPADDPANALRTESPSPGAVVAYEAALSEHKQDRVPLDWAMNMENLGCALAKLGELENSKE